jgi:hypothetical protein
MDMKKLVFSEKENRYVELEFTLDSNDRKIYNESIQKYDAAGNKVKIQNEEDQKNISIKHLEQEIEKTVFAKQRMGICNSCEHFSFKFCKECSKNLWFRFKKNFVTKRSACR